MPRPILSIVTISFNQCHYLREAIESVLSQKGDSVEYIIVDPGSTDGSRELILSYGKRIDHVIFERDSGPADGLNRGFAKATGRSGYFLNSDDFLLPHATEILQNFWTLDQATKVFLCNGWMVDEAGLPLRELRPTGRTQVSLLQGHTMFQQGMSFCMAAFRKCGGFNASNYSSWDYELLCELLAGGASAAYSANRIAAFRLHGGSLTGGAAGAKHSLMYQADVARIRKLFGSGLPPLSTFQKLQQCHTLKKDQLFDTLFPTQMRKRYFLDLEKL